MDPAMEPFIIRARNAVTEAYQQGWADALRASGIAEQETAVIEKADHTFDDIWKAYQHKVGRSAAVRVWRKMPARDKVVARAAVGKYVARTHPTGEGGLRYRAHLATWLNGRRWEDDIPHVGGGPDTGPLEQLFTLD